MSMIDRHYNHLGVPVMQPNNRPSIEAVLQCLEMVPNLSAPPSPGVDEGVDGGGDDWNSTASSSGGDSLDFFDTDDRVQPLSTHPRRDLQTTDKEHQYVVTSNGRVSSLLTLISSKVRLTVNAL